jgi:hypothetical protein
MGLFYPTSTQGRINVLFVPKRHKQALADICKNKIQGKTGTENE